jgi:hypothetical protein
MSDNFGLGVSRVLDPKSTQYIEVIFNQGSPLLDSEFNLVGDLAAGLNRQQVLSGITSGWLGNDTNPSKVYVTDPTWSNWFQFGRQRTGDKQSIMWANVNGWLVPVTGTKTGDPPGSPDDVNTWNKILLDPPPGSAGDARADFVFLEVWKARISPYPSSLNKPNASAIYKLGNVEGGMSYLPDDLTDPEIGEETTQRVQLQYRIRVVKGLINLSTNPDGFDQAVVKAQGTQATPPSVGGYTFTNMRDELGDPGLWRAGDGSDNVLGTVDGYVYAIPLCIVFRRNTIQWAGEPYQNLNGGFNRNPTAVDRTGTLTFSTVPTLAADLDASTLSTTLVLATNIALPSAPTSTLLIKIDEELMTYSSISGTTITLTSRGANGTAAAVHNAGSTITVVSSRPDGLYSDQVTLTDILDLRHVVNPAGFNYTSLLRSNLDKLLKGQLRANWKLTGADPRGAYLLYEDKVSATPPVSLGITQLDAPDHIRLAFSDAAVQQPVEVIFQAAHWSGSPPSFPVSGAVSWGLSITTVEILNQSVVDVWTVGDQLRIPIDQFKDGLSSSDVDQIRILNDEPSSGTGTSYGSYQFIDATALRDFVGEGVEVGDIIVIGTGAAAGTYTITEVTTTVLEVSTIIPSATSSYVIRKGVGAVQVWVDGQAAPLAPHNFSVTPANPDSTEDLVITLVSGTYTSGTPARNRQLNVRVQIQYGGGRGLSRRPDSIHNVTLLNPGASLLHQTEYTQVGTFPLRTAWTALWSKYRSDTYKSLLPVTAEAYADLGSKTVVLTPFQAILIPQPTPIVPGGTIMPLSGSDPLSLFDKTRYSILPRHLVPGWGAVEIPIIPETVGGNFHRGINFMLMSQEGVAAHTTSFNTDYINYSGTYSSCSAFSTLNLSTSLPAVYNTLYHYPTIPTAGDYAGIRKFNDDPSVIGALSTARGLGRHGLELPPYYGIARLFAVYEAQDYKLRGSSFATSAGGTRSFTGTGATNLLRGDFNGPTFWIELDTNGDSTFILNADTIDISKSPNLITDFDSGDYVVESCVFGFDRGSFDINQTFKLAVTSAALAQPLDATVPLNAILPGPLSGSDTALVNYSRTPYQGDAWGTTTTFLDKGFTPGPLTSSDAYNLSSTELSPTGLTRPNQKSLEVLASVGFITTLGTGRLSGDFSLSNAYDIRNVGYEDPTDPAAPYPPPSTSAPRPLVKSGALGSLSNYGDLEANPEYLGCTERLPLGGLYRDKDFHGSRFSDEFSSPLVYLDTAGVGSGVAGLARTNELDQTEVLAMPASVSAGVPGDVLVLVDGEPSNYTQLLNYRTNRGGSVFVGSGERPGGEVFATYSRLTGSGKGTRVLVGRAFLVRNAPTLVGTTQISGGDELMLAITTQVMELGTTPIEAMILIGTNGSGEGYAAADLYRIEGHPLLANHTFYDVDPSAIQLPLGKTIAQITAPSPDPVIPTGAANSVYASDGTRNFWTNIPSVTGADIIGDLSIGGNIVFTPTNPGPIIYQGIQAPGVNGKTLSILSQGAVPNSSSVDTNSGQLGLGSGDINSSTLGLHANTGLVTLHSGSLNSNSTGNTGGISIVTGTNSGTGLSGNTSIGTGLASNGNSGDITVTPGIVSGTTGDGGSVQITGGSVNNSGNSSGAGGDVIIKGGNSVSPNGVGGYLHFYSGYCSIDPGGIDFTINGTTGTRYVSITNANLVIGPYTPTIGNYGIQFTNTTTNPTIGQATGTSGGSTLTIRSQDGGTGSFAGGSLSLQSGSGTGGAVNGDILFTNGSLTNVRITNNDTSGGVFGSYLTEFGNSLYSNSYSLVFSSKVNLPIIGQQAYSGSAPTLTVGAAGVATSFTGTGGNLLLSSGLGRSAANGSVVLATPVGDRVTISDNQVKLEVANLSFAKEVGTLSIIQEDQTSSSMDCSDLYIRAQAHTSTGFHDGGDLSLSAGYGSTDGGVGGAASLHGGNGQSGWAGGDVQLVSGQGTPNGRVLLISGTNASLEAHSTGTTLRNPTGGASGLSFTDSTANPTPDTSTDGILFSRDGRLEFYSNTTSQVTNLTREIISGSDVTDITKVTSSGSSVFVTSVVMSPPNGCKIGDIIEGDIYFRASPNADPSPDAYVNITFNEDSTLDMDQHQIITPYHAGPILINYALPFSHVVVTDCVSAVINLYCCSGDSSTTLYLYPAWSMGQNIWLKWRIIRPATT